MVCGVIKDYAGRVKIIAHRSVTVIQIIGWLTSICLVRPWWKGETDKFALYSNRKLGTVRHKSELVLLHPAKPPLSHTSAGFALAAYTDLKALPTHIVSKYKRPSSDIKFTKEIDTIILHNLYSWTAVGVIRVSIETTSRIMYTPKFSPADRAITL
jgi:hypothetical protein